MDILTSLRNRASKISKTIALPEADDERTLKAASMILKQKIANITLIGNAEAIRSQAASLELNVAKANIIDPDTDPDYPMILDTLVELRKAKGITQEQAKAMLKDTISYAAMLVKLGKVDGYVSGAAHSTADTLRPALQVIKTAKNVKLVSAFFMMVLPDSSPYASKSKVLFYADSGLNPNPTAEELAHIALNTAHSWKQLVPDIPPVVALLSFSTKGSAKHNDVDKVVKATKIAQELAKERSWDLPIDGELQADSALIESIGQKKAPGSTVAGHANVLIFPDLDAGNIAYKLTERLVGATAIGPLISGMARPVNDLSRGCKAEDIVDAVAVTACQAAE